MLCMSVRMFGVLCIYLFNLYCLAGQEFELTSNGLAS
jgi:hypothetical protein